MTAIKKLPWIVILTGLVVTGIFFKSQLSSQGFVGFGDFFDGLIALSLVHHWYNFFHGVENWQTIGYFYPYVNTLGYNDGFFLYGVFYTLFRALHVNLFLALELSSASIRLIGFYAFFYLARQQLRLQFWPSLLAAAVFSLSTTAATQAGHIQLLTVSFAPLLTIFLIRYFNAVFIQQNTQRAFFWGSAAGLLYASWLFSTYYMAWFYTFFAILFLTFLFCFQIRHFNLKTPPLTSLLVPLAITVLALIPFLMTYLPIAAQSGMHTYNEVHAYLPSMKNLLDIERHNLIWRPLLKRLDLPDGEGIVGFPPIFLIIFAMTVIQAMFSRQSDKLVFVRPLIFAVVTSLLLTLSFDGKSLWWFVWNYFPGAKGLRVVCRDWIFLVFPMSLLLACFFSRVTKSAAGKTVLVLVSLLLIAEQYSKESSTYLRRTTEQAFVDSSSAIPSSCRVFYVTGTRHKDLSQAATNYLNNVDAMLISEITGRRTINGFSTFEPSDWDFAYFPQETYLSRVNVYLKKHQITQNVCWFDIDKMQWQAFAS